MEIRDKSGESHEEMYPLTAQEMERIETDTGVTLSQSRGIPLYLYGKSRICGTDKDICFELDTGADRCIIAEGAARELGLMMRRFKEGMSVIGIEGKKVQCDKYSIVNLVLTDVGGRAFSMNILCYIFEGKVPNLLGNDVMGYLKAKIDFERKILSFDNRDFGLSDKRRKSKGKNWFYIYHLSITGHGVSWSY